MGHAPIGYVPMGQPPKHVHLPWENLIESPHGTALRNITAYKVVKSLGMECWLM